MKYSNEVVAVSACRICKEKSLYPFLSLGTMPPANRFIREEKLGSNEPAFPLEVCFCKNCRLVQLRHIVPPGILFKDYPYLTGASAPLISHFTRLAESVILRFNVPAGSLVIDIGSNDGTLLQGFRKLDMQTLGIEPAANIAELANTRGIETINMFFNENLAKQMLGQRGKARLITAANVFAHVPDLDSLLRGISLLLADNGTLVVEVPYLVDLMEKLEFDTIYHEHLAYFALRPLQVLFAGHNMNIIDVERIDSAGGSVRIYVEKSKEKLSSSLKMMLEREEESGLYEEKTYDKFAGDVKNVKRQLVALLRSLKAQGFTIAGYGAAAKGNVLLNYCGVGADTIDYIVDTTPFKQGCYTPGMHIPVVPENHFHTNPPQYALLLAWNYAGAIIAKEQEFLRAGGAFILPIPEPRIINYDTITS